MNKLAFTSTEPVIERPSPWINVADPRQDAHRVRKHDPNLNRYRVTESLLPVRPRGLEVLELGGGTGELSRRMKARGHDVTFVDLSEQNVKYAEAMGFKAHRLDLNYGLPVFEDAQFNGVVMLEIIEHVVAAEELLAEASRVVKPGGFLILSTPNFAFFQNRFRILMGGLSDDEGYHYRFFTKKSLEGQLRNAGFEIDRSSHTMPAFGVNMIRNRIFHRSRLHVRVPNPLAPFFSHTLIVRARKVG